MARPIRLTVPDHPHHVTHRGNNRQRTFFGEHD
jgi:REP element-mobilizing transposase RayT